MNSPTPFEHIIYQVEGGICTITLNRPDVYHALNASLLHELTRAFQQVAAEETIRVVILTATGAKAFCSGADLKEAVTLSIQMPLADIIRQRYNPLILNMRNLPKPIICRLNGIAAGAGCSLALACDVIIASEEASLAEIFVNIGLIMDAGSSFFLPRFVGWAKAFELATTGRPVKASEAREIGLVNRVLPADRLLNCPVYNQLR